MMRIGWWLVAVLLLLAIWTAGCGVQQFLPATLEIQAQNEKSIPAEEIASTPVASPQSIQDEGKTATPVSTPVSEADQEVKVPSQARTAVKAAVQDLAGRLGISPESIKLVSVEAVEWSDTSLGCPEPDMVYAQMITPGFLLKLSVRGKEYRYHTDDVDLAVMCEREQ